MDFLSKNSELQRVQDIIRLMKVSVSISGAMAPENGTKIEELFNKADKALYLTKNKGKNGYTFFREEEVH